MKKLIAALKNFNASDFYSVHEFAKEFYGKLNSIFKGWSGKKKKFSEKLIQIQNFRS